MQRFAARFRRVKPPSLALALANIAGPGSLARSIAVSLGLGLGLLVAVALIHRSLVTEISSNIEVDAPAYYFLDVEASDLDAFKDKIRAIEPDAKLDDAPMLRGRIVALNGVPVDKVEAAPDARWVLAGDRGLTYTDSVPPASTITEGEWWPKGYSGPPLVSFDAELAKGLGLKLGDPITVNILGRNIDATIASLRKIDWESLAINFVMVFSPNTLDGAPHRMLTTLEFPKGTAPDREGQSHSGAVRSLSLGHRHQGRRHRRCRQGPARQGDDRDQRHGRRHAVDRRRRAGGRGGGRPGAAQISGGDLQDVGRHAACASSAPSCSNSACSALPPPCWRW